MSPFSLADTFPVADEAAWRALVEKALRGANYEKTLVSNTYDDLRLDPLYTGKSDKHLSGLPGLPPYTRGFHASPAARPWDICQLHSQASPAAVNTSILEDLNGGVTSIALQIAAPGQFGMELSSPADLSRVLDGVFLDFASLSLNAGAHFAETASLLQSVWREKNIASDEVSGAFNADPVAALARSGELPIAMEQAMEAMAKLALATRDTYPNVTAVLVDARPYHDGGASEAQELACLCATLVSYLRMLETAGLEPEEALRQIRFSLSCDTDQFLSIAKLRAARMLIARIAESCGGADKLGTISLHATTSCRMLTERDPWTNILRTAMACSAAALGGADAITVLPFTWALGQPNDFARRIARNIQIVLQEESAIGNVIDPAGGSWYVENLTTDLASCAWKIFQKIETRGGIVKALETGFLQSMISETAKKRAAAIALSKDELVGITAYPQVSDSPIKVEPHPLPPESRDPAITVEPIRLRRPAEMFDRMRYASDACYDRTGQRARVFLANLGETGDFATRATYAQNLFAIAGIDIISNAGSTSVDEVAAAFQESRCSLVCICSSDEIYDRMAQDVARALTQKDAQHIYLAGRPGEERAQLRKSGVGTFIHKGCDIVSTLRDAQDFLGIRAV